MHGTTIQHIEGLQEEFNRLKKGKDSLLTLLEESELPEAVYNSNAIENSTLTLDDTEKILMHQALPPHHSQREIFEAINLGKVTEYLDAKILDGQSLNETLILMIHQTLLSHINDDFAGRYRRDKEFVRVGMHIAPAPSKIVFLIDDLLDRYRNGEDHPLQRILEFHLEFEHIHPFIDGNGRVGRALMSFQLKSHGFPPIIVRNKEKHDYYSTFQDWNEKRVTKDMEHIMALLLKESLHKRIAYLRGDDIVLLSQLAKEDKKHSPQTLANGAKKQSIPAFRERGRWKVGREMFNEWAS